MRSKKTRHLEMTVSTIQQRWGPQALRKLDTAAMTVEFPHISTGFPTLDEALGIGGLAKGRVSELLGPATSGKTTLALKFLFQAQADGNWVGYVDHAHNFDPDYAHRCGLDLSRLLIVSPHDTGEALAMTEALIGSGSLAALVFDGLDVIFNTAHSGTVPRQGDKADTTSLLAACLDRLVAPLARSETAAFFLHTPLSTPSPGLSALTHHATLRLCVTRERWLRRHGDIRGYQARVKVLKNRLGPPGRTVSLTIEFNGTVRGNGL